MRNTAGLEHGARSGRTARWFPTIVAAGVALALLAIACSSDEAPPPLAESPTPAPEATPVPKDTLAAERGSVEVRFETTWGSNRSTNALAEGKVTFLAVNGTELLYDDLGVIAGRPDAEQAGFGGIEDGAALAFISLQADGSFSGFTIVVPVAALRDGATLVIGEHRIAGGVWTTQGTTQPRRRTPDSFAPFSEGVLQLAIASVDEGATISGSFSGVWGEIPPALPSEDEASAGGRDE